MITSNISHRIRVNFDSFFSSFLRCDLVRFLQNNQLTFNYFWEKAREKGRSTVVKERRRCELNINSLLRKKSLTTSRIVTSAFHLMSCSLATPLTINCGLSSNSETGLPTDNVIFPKTNQAINSIFSLASWPGTIASSKFLFNVPKCPWHVFLSPFSSCYETFHICVTA